MRNLDSEELKQVYGGGDTDTCEKGNNGWGNGGDDPPPGNSTVTENSQQQSKIDDLLR